ncbi:hypothetical protein ACFSQ7_51495 [Paenibacillus rhizoplanae]
MPESRTSTPTRPPFTATQARGLLANGEGWKIGRSRLPKRSRRVVDRSNKPQPIGVPGAVHRRDGSARIHEPSGRAEKFVDNRLNLGSGCTGRETWRDGCRTGSWNTWAESTSR